MFHVALETSGAPLLRAQQLAQLQALDASSQLTGRLAPLPRLSQAGDVPSSPSAGAHIPGAAL